MKLIFILSLLLSCGVYAQSTQTNVSNNSKTEVSSFSLEKIKANFRINYFSELTATSIKKLNDNEINDDGTYDRVPTTMYHSFNVQYRLLGNWSLFMSPRFSTVLGDRGDLYPGSDPHVMTMDDWQFGVLYNFIRTPTLSYNQTLTHRAPFSNKSKNEFIDSQVEWQHFATWAITPAWRLLAWHTYRYYHYDSRSTTERYRISWRNILNYSWNDKWNTQIGYELDLQHRNKKDNDHPKHRVLNHMKRYHSYISLGMGYSPVRNLTFMPFIRTLDERNIRNETTVVGMWILGRVL